MKFFTLLFLFISFLYGEITLKIATYNVENLFDLEKKGYKYKEYKPYGKSLWNKKNYKIKLNNLSHVIKDIDADIICLEEIHSKKALLDLKYKLKQKGLYYKYYSIADKKNTAIKVAILSKFPFIYSKELIVTNSYKYRNILETKFKIDNKNLYIFVNHWKSKAGPESMRIRSAKVLRDRVEQIGYDKNIILLGDFNSHYEEYKIFKKKRKHNDTNGKTAINHVLRTINNTKDALHVEIKEDNFYNLWYDAKENDRYSYIYRGKKEALDNILISKSLLNNNVISYIPNSINNFSKDYLFKKKQIYRWQVSRAKIRKHKGKGYSDHLAVTAKFLVH